MIKVVGLDCDGSMIHGFDSDLKGQVMPGVPDKIRTLREKKIPFWVGTNQGGPKWRAAYQEKGDSRWERYPSAIDVASDLIRAASRLDITDVPWYVSVYDGRVQKILELSVEESIAEAEMPFGQSLEDDDGPREKMEEIAEDIRKQMQDILTPAIQHATVFSGPYYRKPRPGMILAACIRFGCNPSEMLYVGDREEDQVAAAAAEAQFRHADVYFGRKS
jgi:histidinol phosphatase-like enzyme